MLEKIVLLLTDAYKRHIEDSCEYGKFVEGMARNNTITDLRKADESCRNRMKENPLEIDNTLYLSDDADTLAFLQKQGCYTVAVYHEGVNGLLSGTQFAIESIENVDWEYLYKVYQRFKGQPWEITQTRRCTIREMSPGDLDDLYELYADKRVTRYTEALFQEKEQEKQYIEDYIEHIYKYFGFGTWLIHRKEDGRLIGRAGFNFRPGFDEAELGFVIGYPFWRSGYAFEVCSHLLELGKTVFEFEKIQALVDKENEASVWLLEKLGFYYEKDVVVDGCQYRRYLYG